MTTVDTQSAGASAVAQRHLTVVQLVPALDAGGAEYSTLEIARALVAAGHRSVVISGGGRMVAELEANGSQHITLPVASRGWHSLALARSLRQHFQKLAPEVVHVHAQLSGWALRRAVHGLSPAPHLVTTVHGMNSPEHYGAAMLRGERIIAVSQSVRDYLLAHYPKVDSRRIRVIPRGVDLDAFPFGYRPDGTWKDHFFASFPSLEGAPLLTLAARGTPLKGQRDAIELLAALTARGIDARLLLLGAMVPGSEACVRELEALINRRGLQAKVVMTPPRDDVRDVLAISTLVLQLSRKPETFGRTVLEALALCRPVVGYAHGGVGELLSELYPAGRVPPLDHERLVERTAELLRLAPSIHPLTRYRLQDMQRDVLAVYNELAGV